MGRATARLLGSLGAIAWLLVLAPASSGGADVAVAPISMINATFIPTEHATHFRVNVNAAGFSGPITVSWTITLTCVDQGCPEPPGVHGTNAHPLPAVDPPCDNDGLGTRAPVVQRFIPGQTPEFVWHHPAASQDPTHRYHCDTSKEGPKGHQGVVRVEVSDGHTTCTTSYKGTANTTATTFQEGTTDTPTCQAAGPVPLGLLAALQTMDRRLASLIHTYERGKLAGRAFGHAVDLLASQKSALIGAFLPPVFGLRFYDVYKDLENFDGYLGRAGTASPSAVRSQFAGASAAKQNLETQLQAATGVPPGLLAGLKTLDVRFTGLLSPSGRPKLAGRALRRAIDALVNQEHVLLGTFFSPVFGLRFYTVFRDLEDVDLDFQAAEVDEPLTRLPRPGIYTRALVIRRLNAAAAAKQSLETQLYEAAQLVAAA
ncbi:MAG TPA: hypothetical protein VG165_03800 [Solirubrobacteraceae bacterium]|nr:hypothetical protein [Solirubrobacteraceae bacterium]